MSKFLPFQEEVCKDTEETKPDISKYCETCVSDPNYIEPRWWETEQPYLNKKTCEYSTIVTVNDFGDTYTHSTVAGADMSFNELLKTYVKNGLKFMRNYYNKEEVGEIDGFPLEDFASASDYHFYSFADSAMVVLVTIPAAIWDTIEEKPIIEPVEPKKGLQTVTINAKELNLNLRRLGSAIGTYSMFQAMFYRIDGGRVTFKKTKEPFYLKFYKTRVKSLAGEIEALIEKNGYDYGLLSNPFDEAYELKFYFEYNETTETYKFMKIKARKRFGKFRSLKRGLNSFKRSSSSKDEVLMGYLANIKKINLRLNARQSPSWMDFVDEFTFPRAEVHYKDGAFLSGDAKRCINEQLAGVDDFIFDQVISFSDAFVYELNKANKKNAQEINNTPIMSSEFGIKITKERRPGGKKKLSGLAFKLKNMPDFSDASIRDVLSSLNPCKLKEIALTAITCIMGNIDIETAFSAIIKKAFASITADGLEILLMGLPEGTRNKITEEVRVKLGNIPAPWEEDFETGDEDMTSQGTMGNFLTETGADIGTAIVGKPSENEIIQVYQEVMMKFATLQQLMDSFNNLPGVSVLTRLLGVDFPTMHFVQPPISSFLNTLTLDPCGKEWQGIQLPKLINPFGSWVGWSWPVAMGKLFWAALKLTLRRILIAMIRALAEKILLQLPSIGELDCKALHSNAGKVMDILTGQTDLGQMLTDAICSDPLSLKDRERGTSKIMQAAGAMTDKAKSIANGAVDDFVGTVGAVVPSEVMKDLKTATSRADSAYNISDKLSDKAFVDSITDSITSKLFADPEPYNALAKAISVSSTKNEIIRAMTLPEEEQSRAYFMNMRNTLPNVVPAFAKSFDTIEKVKQFFAQLGSKLTPAQRQVLQDSITPDDEYLPLEDTICLSKEQMEAWNRERQAAFENSGLDPQRARDFVNKQNDRIKSDLDDMLDLFSRSPEELLQDAIDKALGADGNQDKCINPEVALSIQDTPLPALMQKASADSFKRLQKAYLDDVIEWNFFERLWDTPGLISMILADKHGFTLNYHNVVNGSPILKFFFPDPGENPETVSYQMFEYIENSNFLFSNGICMMNYDNGLDEDDKYVSVLSWMGGKKEAAVIVDPTKSFSFKPLYPRAPSIKLATEHINQTFGNARIRGARFSDDRTSKLIENINGILFNKFSKSLFYRNKDKDPSLGFVHSKPEELITKEDLEYVGPSGEKYDYEEDQAILGRSKSGSDRVVWLDPSEHGGTYRRPKFFIKPQDNHEGWMQISRIFVPKPTEDSPKETFLDIPDIVKQMDRTRNMEADPRLQLSPEFVIEIPFDKVCSPVRNSFIEGAINATIRTFIADFFIRAMPVIVNLEWDIDKNYDDMVVSYVMKNMKTQLQSQTHSFKSSYTGFVYWMLFLEQSVQMFNRKYEHVKKRIEEAELEGREVDSDLERLNEQFSAHDVDLKFIKAAQENHIIDNENMLMLLRDEYTWNLTKKFNVSGINTQIDAKRSALETLETINENAPNTGDYLGTEVEIEELKEEIEGLMEEKKKSIAKSRYGHQLARGCMLAGYGRDFWKPKNFGMLDYNHYKKNIKQMPPEKVDLDKQYGFIFDREFGCKFKSLDLEGAKLASKMFTIFNVEGNCERILATLVKEQMKSYKSIITDNTKPRIKDINKYFLGSSQTLLNAPEIGIMNDDGEESNNYSSIKGPVSDPSKEHPLDNISISTKELDMLKTNGGLYLEKYLRIIDKDGSPLSNRGASLEGVVDPALFLQFLLTKKNEIDLKKPVSEYFGDAEIIDGAYMAGSIGIKYGLRLCYTPPDNFINPQETAESKKMAKREKSFIMKEAQMTALPDAVSAAFKIAKDNADEAMVLLTAAIPALGAALAIAGVGGDEFEKVIEIVEGLVPKQSYAGSKYAFPICSYEQDIPDLEIGFYTKLADDSFGQDMDCFFDSLINTPEYKAIFHESSALKTIPSLMAVYSHSSFLAALGVHKKEREDNDEADLNTNNINRLWNDSYEVLKNMFISAYIRDNFDTPEDDWEDDVKKGKNKQMNQTLDSVAFDKVPWFSKLGRKMDSPFNPFGALFKNKYRKIIDFD